MGILLPPDVLRSVLRGRPTNESVIQYAVAADHWGLQAVLFSLDDYHPSDGQIQGYAWLDGKWRPWVGPVPRVVHNRVFTVTPLWTRRLQAIHHDIGDGLFNPPFSRDKWELWQLLASADDVKPHLPPTWLLDRSVCYRAPDLVSEYGSLVAKPRVGQLGMGIVVIEPLSAAARAFCLVSFTGRTFTVGQIGLRNYLRRLGSRRGGYILQQTIPLITYMDRRCDVRVPVQRGAQGTWQVVPPTVKQATRLPYVTNIARGGQAFSFQSVMSSAFGSRRVEQIGREASRVALNVAHRLAQIEPALADLGLDIGIDPAGKPWLIEVNLRDQRLVSKAAGEEHIHAQLYHHPIDYAAYLLRMKGRIPNRRAV